MTDAVSLKSSDSIVNVWTFTCPNTGRTIGSLSWNSGGISIRATLLRVGAECIQGRPEVRATPHREAPPQPP